MRFLQTIADKLEAIKLALLKQRAITLDDDTRQTILNEQNASRKN
ncbi:MAG: hypothetical protein WKF91_16475 [Segetibacter sp.]